MKTNTTGKLTAALLAAALGAGVAGAAWAQDNNADSLPQIHTQGNVSYTSGGVGLDESQALLGEQAHWPLAMRFTGQTSDYLADVHVRIVNTKGRDVLNAESTGPYMLVKLPPGGYTVYARYEDQELKRPVSVAGPGRAKADFRWNIQ